MEVILIKTYTIYASMQNPEDSVARLEAVFKQKKHDVKISGRNIKVTNKRLFSKELINVAVILKENDLHKFEAQIQNITSLFSSSEKYGDEEINKLILTQALYVNVVIFIETEHQDNYLEIFKEINSKLCGVALFNNGELINNSGQTVYDADGGRTEAGINVYADEILITLPVSNETEENLSRRQASINKLISYDIPFTLNLPILPDSDQLTLRTKDEICERAVSLLFLIQYAIDVSQGGNLAISRVNIIDSLNRYEVSEALTHWEQQFLYTDTPSLETAIKITWQYEALCVLLWALGHAESLDFPDSPQDNEFAVKLITSFDFYDDFFDSSRIRAKSEILDTADFIYRLDWSCTSAKNKKGQLPHNINPLIVSERCRAFNWLMNFKSAR